MPLYLTKRPRYLDSVKKIQRSTCSTYSRGSICCIRRRRNSVKERDGSDVFTYTVYVFSVLLYLHYTFRSAAAYATTVALSCNSTILLNYIQPCRYNKKRWQYRQALGSQTTLLDNYCPAKTPVLEHLQISRFDMLCAQAHWVGSNRSLEMCHWTNCKYSTRYCRFMKFYRYASLLRLIRPTTQRAGIVKKLKVLLIDFHRQNFIDLQ